MEEVVGHEGEGEFHAAEEEDEGEVREVEEEVGVCPGWCCGGGELALCSSIAGWDIAG